MRYVLHGDLDGLETGIGIIFEKFGSIRADEGIPINVKQAPGDLMVLYKDGTGYIQYSEKVHFFRALGMFLEYAKDEKDEIFQMNEVPQFKTMGAMFDVSRNAVMKVDSIKKMLEIMALMGFNMMVLYTEDIYTIEEKPYFGYMRGRYSFKELKECDDYADIFGIEIVPCIQTLGHLTQALKWKDFSKIKDTPDILLAGCDETYEFIDQMIKSISAPFRSRRIHIGMDEAHNVGLGRYLDLNGYQDRFGVINMHLNNVAGICENYGLKPMIWSDMYFRLASKTGDYYDLIESLPEEVLKCIPKGIDLVYWDYYHTDEGFYRDYIKKHRDLGIEPVFAGGIWTWMGIGTNYGKTFITTNAALMACKRESVGEVFTTVWMDGENNFFSSLLGLQLFAEHGYSFEISSDKIIKRFKCCTGADFNAFMDLKYLDETPGTNKDNYEACNPAKILLWQDVLIGLIDKHIAGLDLSTHYKILGKKMQVYKKQNPEWSFVFKVPEKLCHVLSLKSDIGLKIKEFYGKKDFESLRCIVDYELPKLKKYVVNLRMAHREQWLKTNKVFGWEVLDIRYGGLLARIETAICRLRDYIEGNVTLLEELEEERLYFDGLNRETNTSLCMVCQYQRIVSACPL